MPTEALFLAGAAAAVLAIGYLLLARSPHDNALVATAALAGFALYSVITIAAEGPLGFVANHDSNLWGVQVWYDLVIALTVALTFVVPRARAVGMNVPLYLVATGLSGSIGLLAMVARLFWLERRAA